MKFSFHKFLFVKTNRFVTKFYKKQFFAKLTRHLVKFFKLLLQKGKTNVFEKIMKVCVHFQACTQNQFSQNCFQI